MRETLAAVGAGAGDTALASHAVRAGLAPRPSVFEPEPLELLRRARENAWYLPGGCLPDAVTRAGSLGDAAAGAETVVIAVPSRVFCPIAIELAPHLGRDAGLLSATKGPEVARERPTAAVIASTRIEPLAGRLQRALATPIGVPVGITAEPGAVRFDGPPPGAALGARPGRDVRPGEEPGPVSGGR